MRRVVVLVGLAAVLVVGRSGAPAGACTCVDRTLDEKMDASDVVLVGDVVGSETVDDPPSIFDAVRNTVAVERVYVGEAPAEVVVFGGMTSSGGCEYGFGDGRHLIFARREADGLHTDVCTGTAPLGPEEAVPDELGPGVPPLVEVAAPRRDEGGSHAIPALDGVGGVIQTVVVVGIVVAGIGVVVWLVRTVRPPRTRRP